MRLTKYRKYKIADFMGILYKLDLVKAEELSFPDRTVFIDCGKWWVDIYETIGFTQVSSNELVGCLYLRCIMRKKI